jgi:hypothetical protein
VVTGPKHQKEKRSMDHFAGLDGGEGPHRPTWRAQTACCCAARYRGVGEANAPRPQVISPDQCSTSEQRAHNVHRQAIRGERNSNHVA